MNSQNSNYQIAMDLISQYGEDAESIAMLRAAEYALGRCHQWDTKYQR